MHYLYPTTWINVAGKLQFAGGSTLWWALVILGLLITGLVFYMLEEEGNDDAPFSILVGTIISLIFAWAWPLAAFVLCVVLWLAVFAMIALLPGWVLRRISAFRAERAARKKIQESLDNQ